MRLLNDEGKQIGIYTKEEALKMAGGKGVDLVEIAPKADPPVCKLVDFKKFKYREKKREREARRKARATDLKKIRMRPFIGEHDFQVRAKKAKKFLEEGNRVKVTVQFYGRQITRKEFGYKIFNQLDEELKEIATRDSKPRFQGKELVAFYTQKKK